MILRRRVILGIGIALLVGGGGAIYGAETFGDTWFEAPAHVVEANFKLFGLVLMAAGAGLIGFGALPTGGTKG